MYIYIYIYTYTSVNMMFAHFLPVLGDPRISATVSSGPTAVPQLGCPVGRPVAASPRKIPASWQLGLKLIYVKSY